MSLEQQAQDRKSRLAALRNKRKPNTTTTDESEQPPKKQPPESKIISRNFDSESREHITGFDLPPTTQDENSETVEAVSQKIQDEILKKFQSRVDQGFETSSNYKEGQNIRKKTVTSDLMRDLQPKLDILNERTDEAIQKLLKERIRKLREEATPTTE